VSDSTELLALRLGLIAIIFTFVLVTAFVLQSGVRTKPAAPDRPRRVVRGARLVLVSPALTGLDPGAEFAVAGEMTIGRDPENGIVLADPSVSGRHATIARERGGFRLTDLGSTNGTFANGRPVDRRGVLLLGGEQITLGSVVLRFAP
jgi:hypothetical protein